MVDSPVPATKNISARQFNGLVRNVSNTYKEADEEQRASGALWYPHAYDLATDIGRTARLRVGGSESTLPDHVRGAGIIAALSPQMPWQHNLVEARRMANEGKAGHTRDFVGKARAIREGEHPLDVLGGNKVRNFYGNIVEPDDPDPVTIDRHAHDLAIGRKFPQESDRGLGSAKRYGHFADAYRAAAEHLGVEHPNQIQATTWLKWTDRHSYDE